MKSFKEIVPTLELIFLIGFFIFVIIFSIFNPPRRPNLIFRGGLVIIVGVIWYFFNDFDYFKFLFNTVVMIVVWMVIIGSGVLSSLDPVVVGYIFLIYFALLLIVISYSFIDYSKKKNIPMFNFSLK